MVRSLFQIFFSLFGFICLFLQSSSNPGTDFGDSFALEISDVIVVFIASIKEYTWASSLFAV